jgi:nucleoside-diphosphate-sugar epimerase
MNVCVTGGRGFIGAHLISALNSLGWRTRALSRVEPIKNLGVSWYLGDLLDFRASFADFLADAQVVFHCAGEIHDTTLMHLLHVGGTERLLEGVRRNIVLTGKRVHWVQLSSVGAYGPPNGSANAERVVLESTACAPKGDYEVTKTRADQLVQEFARSEPLFSYTILRPSNVIGSEMPNQSLRSLVKLVRKRWFFYIGSKRSIATYIHVDDVVAALILCATHPSARGEVFNLSSDCFLHEIVDEICGHKTGASLYPVCIPEWPVRIAVRGISTLGNSPLTPERVDALVRRTRYPADKIATMLGYKQKTKIPAAIAAMFE